MRLIQTANRPGLRAVREIPPVEAVAVIATDHPGGEDRRVEETEAADPVEMTGSVAPAHPGGTDFLADAP